jgi:hypothetical protein
MMHLALSGVSPSSKMSGLDETLSALRARRDRLKSQLDAISEAINKIEKIIRALPPEALEHITASSPDIQTTQDMGSSRRAKGFIPPRDVALAAKSALLAAGRPLKRGALVAELEKRGVILAGTDKNKNLGTILWRHSELFVTIKKLGYWVKDIPLPGVYEPEDQAN